MWILFLFFCPNFGMPLPRNPTTINPDITTLEVGQEISSVGEITTEKSLSPGNTWSTNEKDAAYEQSTKSTQKSTESSDGEIITEKSLSPGNNWSTNARDATYEQSTKSTQNARESTDGEITTENSLSPGNNWSNNARGATYEQSTKSTQNSRDSTDGEITTGKSFSPGNNWSTNERDPAYEQSTKSTQNSPKPTDATGENSGNNEEVIAYSSAGGVVFILTLTSAVFGIRLYRRNGGCLNQIQTNQPVEYSKGNTLAPMTEGTQTVDNSKGNTLASMTQNVTHGGPGPQIVFNKCIFSRSEEEIVQAIAAREAKEYGRSPSPKIKAIQFAS